ncbi:hypothetical protein ANN_17382 [Periplaneta americana]|uniref:Per a allergen n=1 Tax=Periplaneta americana TaxID=6978 RepID=A0ABQ8SSS6_PERAM|nr:hypothetical protein ANN_17382 [Periplaneta americana]
MEGLCEGGNEPTVKIGSVFSHARIGHLDLEMRGSTASIFTLPERAFPLSRFRTLQIGFLEWRCVVIS